MKSQSLIDANILVYCADPRDPFKQQIAQEALQAGMLDGTLVLAHQSLVEFIAAVTRPRRDLGGLPIRELARARLNAEEWMASYPVLYPSDAVLRTALRGATMYGLSWFDAHLWAYAEVYGLAEILSEDFQHGRYYGTVRVVDPFLQARGGIHELPPLYAR